MSDHKFMTWQDMAEILQMKTDYDTIISESDNVSVPKNRKSLTVETAKWFVESGKRFNRVTDDFVTILDLCEKFVSKSEMKWSRT